MSDYVSKINSDAKKKIYQLLKQKKNVTLSTCTCKST